MSTTPTMQATLLPCPFCGAGQTEIHENGKIWAGMRYSEPTSVSVRHWCAEVQGQPSRMLERVGRDTQSAISAWNLRPLAAPTKDSLAGAAQWRPIETAPDDALVVVGWLDAEDAETPERHDFDYKEDGCWRKHADDVEYAGMVAPPDSRFPPEKAPYTHWLPIPPIAAPSPAPEPEAALGGEPTGNRLFDGRPLLKESERIHTGLDERKAWKRAIQQFSEARLPFTNKVTLTGATIFCTERCLAYWRDRAYAAEAALTAAQSLAADRGAEVGRLRERLDEALFVLGMVDKNNRIDAGEKGKAWSGRFVVEEVRRVLALAQTAPAQEQTR